MPVDFRISDPSEPLGYRTVSVTEENPLPVVMVGGGGGGVSLPIEIADVTDLQTELDAKAATAALPSAGQLVPAGGGATTFLRGDATWVVPTNTTYPALAAAAAQTGTATTASSISAKVLADEVDRRITLKVPAPPVSGTFVLTSVDGAISWVAGA